MKQSHTREWEESNFWYILNGYLSVEKRSEKLKMQDRDAS